MPRLRFVFGLVMPIIVASAAVAQEPVRILAAQGTIEKLDRETLTLHTRDADGKFGASLTLKLTFTSSVSHAYAQKRGDQTIVGQRDGDAGDLKLHQSITVIYAGTPSHPVLLKAVIHPTKQEGAPAASAAKLPDGVPAKVATVLKHIDDNKTAPDGYEGGRSFLNLGRNGEESLPRKDARGRSIAYQEWDVNPKIRGRDRGAERLITGSDGSAYYTDDHYRTFTKVR